MEESATAGSPRTFSAFNLLFSVLMLLVGVLLVPGQALAVPFWGAKTSSPAGTPPNKLKPGEFVWAAGIAPDGPMVVVVSLTEQRAYVYRNGVQIGYSTASSGKPGHETPTGIFTILQKDADHHSSLYNDAAMPDQQRLTWDGVALHAGGLPGYPSSHGCVHLPSTFAKSLFAESHLGMTVVIVDAKTAPADVVHPAALAPVDPAQGGDDIQPRLQAGETARWQPEKSLDGPLSILMSAADKRVIVVRNGVEIGRAQIAVNDPQKPLGTHAFIVKAGEGQGSSVLLTGAVARNWMAVPMPSYGSTAGSELSSVVGGRVRLPQEFARELYPLLVPGTTLLVTDAPLLAENSGSKLTVISSGNPN
jgi:hypothetical protein